MAAQETIEMPTALVTTQKDQHINAGASTAAANRSEDEGNSSGTQPAANGSFKMDESFTRSQNSNPGKEGSTSSSSVVVVLYNPHTHCPICFVKSFFIQSSRPYIMLQRARRVLG